MFYYSRDLLLFSPSLTETYDFLAIEYASKDKVMDVLFVLKDTEPIPNNTCANAGIKNKLIKREDTRVCCVLLLFCVIQTHFSVSQVCPLHVCL